MGILPMCTMTFQVMEQACSEAIKKPKPQRL